MKHFRWLIATILTALVISGPAYAQKLSDDPRVASALEVLKVWLDAQRAYEQIPGVSGAVVYDQELVWSGGSGYADPARKARRDTEHDLQHLLDLETFYQHRRHAAARRGQAAIG